MTELNGQASIGNVEAEVEDGMSIPWQVSISEAKSAVDPVGPTGDFTRFTVQTNAVAVLFSLVMWLITYQTLGVLFELSNKIPEITSYVQVTTILLLPLVKIFAGKTFERMAHVGAYVPSENAMIFLRFVPYVLQAWAGVLIFASVKSYRELGLMIIGDLAGNVYVSFRLYLASVHFARDSELAQRVAFHWAQKLAVREVVEIITPAQFIFISSWIHNSGNKEFFSTFKSTDTPPEEKYFALVLVW